MRLGGHHRNFALCLALECLWAIHFSVATTVMYYKQFGIDITTVLAMQALMGLASTVCDAPFGYLAVRLGVRRVMLIGIVLQLVQCCMFAFWCRTVPQFCLTLVLNGVAWSLTSGTTKAMMTATDPEEITTYAARAVQARAVGQLFGVLTGGALVGEALAGHASVATPVLIQPITFVLALPVAYAVKSSDVIHSRTTHPKLSSVFSIGKLMLITRPQVRWMVLLTASINAAVLAMMWLAQPDMEAAGVTLDMFGPVYAVRTLATAFFAQLVGTFVRRFNRVNTQITLTSVVVVCATFAGSPTGVAGAVAILLANALATAVTDPLLTGVIKDYMPEAEEDGQAATIYSVASAVQTGLFIVSPLMGWINGRYSTDAALLCIAGITLAFSSLCIYKYRQSTKPSGTLETS